MSAVLVGVKYKSDKRDQFLHHGGWLVKLMLWLGFNALPFFFPVGLVNAYGEQPLAGGRQTALPAHVGAAPCQPASCCLGQCSLFMRLRGSASVIRHPGVAAELHKGLESTHPRPLEVYKTALRQASAS